MIKTIDLKFGGVENAIAVYLLQTNEGAALFETGPHSTLPTLMEALKEEGIAIKDIKHVFLTHIHMDHAGAAWCFAEHGAKVYVHPRGYKHLANPEKLMASAKRIYLDKMDSLWGQMKAIPNELLYEVADKEQFQLGQFQIEAHYTPGHAVHHIAWKIGKDLVAGDVAGVKIALGPVVAPCPPPDIHIEDWQNSIDRLLDLDIDCLYLSHFGAEKEVKKHLQELKVILWDWANWMKPHYVNQTEIRALTKLFSEYVFQQLAERGVSEERLAVYETANPARFNVPGLLRYWHKKLNPKTEKTKNS